jgi:NAD+ synthase
MVLERSRTGVSTDAPAQPAAAVDAPVAAPETVADPAGSVSIALAQFYPRLGDVAANLAAHLTIIADAGKASAGLVVFPELSLTGYFLKDQVPDVALTLESPEIHVLRDASRAAAIDIVVGLILESDRHLFYNAALYISDGEVLHVHRKVYLPTYGLFDEQRYLAAGDQFRAFDAPLGRRTGHRWRAGLLICEDLWHPSAATLLARQGADLIICPSASPGRGFLQGETVGTASSYDVMTRTYAQLFTTYVVYCNRSGFEDGVGFWGGSRVVDPVGSVVAEIHGAEESVLFHTLERSAVRRARIAYPLLRDDSSVVAALAVSSLGAANVTAVFMPYRTSDPQSEIDARAVCDTLGLDLEVVDITPQVDDYFARFPDADRTRRGNKMARERMSILYDISMARKALVLGTSNKTELLLGYGTLFGDMASALNPIGDLYKTQLYAIARELHLPHSVLTKPPSADLWAGQSDEDELGMRYAVIDEVLHLLVDERRSRDEVIALGFGTADVDTIINRVQGSQYKRRPPVIAKLSNRTIDREFRYPRDWGR